MLSNIFTSDLLRTWTKHHSFSLIIIYSRLSHKPVVAAGCVIFCFWNRTFALQFSIHDIIYITSRCWFKNNFTYDLLSMKSTKLPTLKFFLIYCTFYKMFSISYIPYTYEFIRVYMLCIYEKVFIYKPTILPTNIYEC